MGPWTPKRGALELVERVGTDAAMHTLGALLRGEVAGGALLQGEVRRTLIQIGDGHAFRLMADETGARLDYWPRVWAARAMANLGEQSAQPHLEEALSDDHWRVRMTAVRAMGNLGLAGVSHTVVELLGDEHPRVMRAAVRALAHVGDADAIDAVARVRDGTLDIELSMSCSRTLAAIAKREGLAE